MKPEIEDASQYILPDEKRGCDKLHHFLRSLAHQKNHIKHLKDLDIHTKVDESDRDETQDKIDKPK